MKKLEREGTWSLFGSLESELIKELLLRRKMCANVFANNLVHEGRSVNVF